MSVEPDTIILPRRETEDSFPLQRALAQRRSVRTFRAGALTLEEIAQLAWAAQGITAAGGFRTAPSAGALYPLELCLLAGEVREIPSGAYRYSSTAHALAVMSHSDLRGELARAAYHQDSVQRNAVLFLISAVVRRTSIKYGERAQRYVHLEAGHAAQNLLLQATALGLGAVVIGAFNDAAVRDVMNLRQGEVPLYLIPVGRV